MSDLSHPGIFSSTLREVDPGEVELEAITRQVLDTTSVARNATPALLPRLARSLFEHPACGALQRLYAGLGSCLLYHRVEPPGDDVLAYPSPYRGLTVSQGAFEAQMRYLRRNYTCLSWDETIEHLGKGSLPSRSAMVTFDDGYRDNLTAALPVLERYGIPATIYVTTGLIDRAADLWWYEQEFIVRNVTALQVTIDGASQTLSLRTSAEKYRGIALLNGLFRRLPTAVQRALMVELRAQCPLTYSYEQEMLTWEEVRALDRHPLITIGAHTRSHPMLSELDDGEVVCEMGDSKARLERELRHEVLHFAYCFGDVNEVGERERETAARCGFASAVTSQHGHLRRSHAKSTLLLPRISVNHLDSTESLAWKLNGFAAFARQIRRLVSS